MTEEARNDDYKLLLENQKLGLVKNKKKRRKDIGR